jgi:hypothetical protein
MRGRISVQVSAKKPGILSRNSLAQPKNLLFLTYSFITFHNRSMGFKFGLYVGKKSGFFAFVCETFKS